MNLFVIVGIILWLYFLHVFHKAETRYFYYIWGSVGIFIFMMILVQPLVITPLTQLVASATGVVGKLTGMFESYNEYSILFVTTPANNTSISLYIDYECAGVIEMMAYVSLLMFFRVYSVGQRIVLGIVGCIGIFLSNIVRIFIICMSVYFWGSSAYFIAHTIIGRLVFYALSVALYYIVFTRAQIIRQRIGGFSYARRNEDSVQ
ncbi:MAG: exosortase family protein XrtG [Lachnospiraceae bacterium]